MIGYKSFISYARINDLGLRESLRGLFNEQRGMKVIGEAHNGWEVIMPSRIFEQVVHNLEN